MESNDPQVPQTDQDHAERPERPDPLARVIEALTDQEYVVEQPLPGVLQVTGRFSNPERIALRAAADAGDRAIAVWATSHRDDWVLVCWDRPDLVTITQRGGAPQRWRHRRLPATLTPAAQTFLEGAASSFDIVTRPKHQPTEAAREVLARFGITEPAPPGWVAPVVEVPEPVQEALPTARPKTVRAPRASTKAPAKPVAPEPVVKVCPNCFMAIPATGVCDNCG
ncbi:hypothetical protein JK386_06225 [Nocardioides sp. zg-536]|uniref:Uncharacterized protein n=1 Tax=Nocardioides faecalis TaxID=2803858 RepID=A0A939BVE7_9ACTN|nr:hypothetical protein [Nocardioides faecalis]MBM9459492.1 hypothetical protein [Nocardioides faecalis]MBS4751733.1 hypothetical protein [Nocardioides faecalis]QVI59408.1 hypothetical protein KG111_03290 [Nocardioides faecalis]